MASGGIEIVEDTLTPGLARLIGAAGNLTEPMALISEAMLEHTEDRFRHEIDPEGVPWKPSQRALEDGGPTLYDRGFLYNALERDSGSDYAEVGVLASGPAAVYARIQNDGGIITARTAKALKTPFGPRASVTIPKRTFIGIEQRDRTDAETIVLDHLERAAAGAGE